MVALAGAIDLKHPLPLLQARNLSTGPARLDACKNRHRSFKENMMRSMTWLACALFAVVTPLAHAASDTSKSAAVDSKPAGATAEQ